MMMSGRTSHVALLAFLSLALPNATTGAESPEERRPLEERLKPAGLRADEVRQFLDKMKQAFAADGCTAIAKLVVYPYLLPGSPDLGRITRADREPAGPKLDTPEEFVELCETLVTPQVREAVREQSADDLFANWRGVMIGRGEAWFGGICADSDCTSHEVRITRINAGR